MRKLPCSGEKKDLIRRIKEDDQTFLDQAERTHEALDLLIFNHGTKIGHLFHYMRKKWDKDQSARFIVFSANDGLLGVTACELDRIGIANVCVDGFDFATKAAVLKFYTFSATFTSATMQFAPSKIAMCMSFCSVLRPLRRERT